MKRHFVLDENIIILANKGENDRGERDATCLELLRVIETNCHALVIDMGECWERYTSQVKTLERQGALLVGHITNKWVWKG